MIHGNIFADRLGEDITLKMAQWVRDEDSQAVLFLNDYDILTGARLDDYVAHIEKLLAMGVPIGGIGVQGHLHADAFDPATLRNALDVLSRFGLPIRVTEFNIPGQRSQYYENRSLRMTEAQEKANAAALVEYYRICFAHPEVSGILMWGFWEGANWIPQSSLYRRDWSLTSTGRAYRDLVFREWWTTWEGVAGDDGSVEIPGFYGTYQVTTDGTTKSVELTKSNGRAMVAFP
jgi:GH35 family endo-1,4-beta-xylanase